jgi:hypothetical protein
MPFIYIYVYMHFRPHTYIGDHWLAFALELSLTLLGTNIYTPTHTYMRKTLPGRSLGP